MPHAGAGAGQGENQPCQRGEHSIEAKVAKRRDRVTFAPGEAQGRGHGTEDTVTFAPGEAQGRDHGTEDRVTFAPGEAQGRVLHMEVTHRRHAGGHEKDEDKCTPTKPVVFFFFFFLGVGETFITKMQ